MRFCSTNFVKKQKSNFANKNFLFSANTLRQEFPVFFSRKPKYLFCFNQGVTKRCRLSLLTSSALVIRVQMRREGGSCGVSANDYSCAQHVTWSPNKLWSSTAIFNLYGFNPIGQTAGQLPGWQQPLHPRSGLQRRLLAQPPHQLRRGQKILFLNVFLLFRHFLFYELSAIRVF
jgi:hypothetical protein